MFFMFVFFLLLYYSIECRSVRIFTIIKLLNCRHSKEREKTVHIQISCRSFDIFRAKPNKNWYFYISFAQHRSYFTKSKLKLCDWLQQLPHKNIFFNAIVISLIFPIKDRNTHKSKIIRLFCESLYLDKC